MEKVQPRVSDVWVAKQRVSLSGQYIIKEYYIYISMITNNPTFSLMYPRYGNDQYYEANDIPLSLTSAYTYRFGFNGQHKDSIPSNKYENFLKK